MEEHFSIIQIEKKLKSLVWFTGCKGAAISSESQVYAYPVDLKALVRELETSPQTLKEDFQDVRVIPIQGANLILFGYPSDFNESALHFIAEDLEGEIELASIFDSLFKAGLTISSNLSLNPLLHKLMSLCEVIFANEVSAVMLIDHDKQELYWEISRGEGSEYFQRKITHPLGKGIAGEVARTGQAAMVNDVSKDPRWYSSYDIETGFSTKSMMCVPIQFHGKILGVIEIINKKNGKFTARDLKILQVLGIQAGAAIENAFTYKELETAYEELQALNRARERVVSHLSHELGTPLSVISGVLSNISKKLKAKNISFLKDTINRGDRNVKRLFDLKAKIDDILHNKAVSDEERVIKLIEDALSLVEVAEEAETDAKVQTLLTKVAQHLRSVCAAKDTQPEQIPVDLFLRKIREEAVQEMEMRQLEIVEDLEGGLVVQMPLGVLKKVCAGILKNAIENTPDEGRVEITAKSVTDAIRIEFQDYGIGIHPLNKKAIFSGFFHTQETRTYATKKPYEFNAGGTGADLLRMKVFSEQNRFSIGFESTRCKYIPEDSDVCPGQLSECSFIQKRQECLSSGGSLFWIMIPT